MSWPLVRFLEVCNIQGGTQPPKSTFIEQESEGYIRLLQIQDFKRDDKAVYIPKKKALKTCQEDDVLIARYGASLGQIHTGKSGAYNVALAKTIPDLKKLDKKYLLFFLKSPLFQNFLQEVGTRAAQAGFNKADLEKVEIPLPPLAIQKQIAVVLEKADTLRSHCQQMEQELNALAQSVFLDMFGDPVKNPKDWEKLSLGELAEVKGGLQVTHRREVNPLEVPYLRVANVYRDHLDLEEIKKIKVTKQELERTRLLPGDMLVVEGHGNKLEIGRTAIWNGAISDCTHQNHLIRVRFDSKRIRSQFVSCYLNSEGGRLQVLALSKTTSGLNTISTNNVRSISLIVPPLDMQDRFLAIYEKQQEKLNLIKELESQLNINFNSLMQRAFKGELKLKGVA